MPEDLVEERNPTTSRPLALQLAAQSLAIMEANATIEEAVEFKYWLYSIADQVTLAAKAGGFLGFGGTRVSPAEAAFLDELASRTRYSGRQRSLRRRIERQAG